MSAFNTGNDLVEDNDAPKIKADDILRSFRLEAQLSWRDFNNLWRTICGYLNSPANDILLEPTLAGSTQYDRKLWELTSDLLESGLFRSELPGTWTYGRYDNEVHIPAIADYIRRVTEYAVQRIIANMTAPTNLRNIDATKVGAWLTNKVATEWNNYAFVNRGPVAPVTPQFPAPVADGIDASTHIITSKATTPAASPTSVATLPCSLTSIATPRPPGETTL